MLLTRTNRAFQFHFAWLPNEAGKPRNEANLTQCSKIPEVRVKLRIGIEAFTV